MSSVTRAWLTKAVGLPRPGPAAPDASHGQRTAEAYMLSVPATPPTHFVAGNAPPDAICRQEAASSDTQRRAKPSVRARETVTDPERSVEAARGQNAYDPDAILRKRHSRAAVGRGVTLWGLKNKQSLTHDASDLSFRSRQCNGPVP
jgi:hypothetical protein